MCICFAKIFSKASLSLYCELDDFEGGNILGQLAAIFDLLRSPDSKTWPGAAHLPDYGKLKLPQELPDPLKQHSPD